MDPRGSELIGPGAFAGTPADALSKASRVALRRGQNIMGLFVIIAILGAAWLMFSA